jgi:hypothetical protein
VLAGKGTSGIFSTYESDRSLKRSKKRILLVSGTVDSMIKYHSPQRNTSKAARVTEINNSENCPPRSQPPITRSIARSKTEKVCCVVWGRFPM